MSAQDFIDILIVVAWSYGNGFVSAWFFGPLRGDAHRVGVWFALIGWILGAFGIIIRRRSGKFPSWPRLPHCRCALTLLIRGLQLVGG